MCICIYMCAYVCMYVCMYVYSHSHKHRHRHRQLTETLIHARNVRSLAKYVLGSILTGTLRGSTRQHTSAYVSIRQRMAMILAYESAAGEVFFACNAACIRQHTSTYASIRQLKASPEVRPRKSV